MGIFSKLSSNEYNNRLEKILENKHFDISVKNLLLSTLYKIEAGYNDYERTKVKVSSKEEFIEKILYIIKEECSEIKIVTPKTEESKPLEEKNEVCKIELDRGFILVYANEEDLLYSLIKMHILQKYSDEDSENIENYTYYKSAIQKFISIGKAINDSEVIRDFDGWSWNNNLKSDKEIEYNLVYQNIMMSNMNIEDKKFYTENYEQTINQPYKFEKSIYVMMMALVAEDDEDIRNKIYEQLKKNSEVIELMDDKTKFLNKVTNEKKQIVADIKYIDEILNDRKKLKKEYISRNSKLEDKEKIFSMSHLSDRLEKERKEKLDILRLKNKLLEPLEYIKQKEVLENEYQLLKNIKDILEDKELKKEMIINTQIELLKCFEKQIEDVHDKENLEKILYKFRYYCLLPISKEKYIFDIKELKEPIKKVMNEIIDNSIDVGLITNFSNSTSLCYNVLKHVFTTKIIDLKEISIKIVKIKEEKKGENTRYTITVSIYDAKEEEKVYTEVVNNLMLLGVKLNKKIPLFLK